MQRRLIVGPAQPHQAADDQREDGDRRLDEVQRAMARRHAAELQPNQPALALPEDRVGELFATATRVEDLEHIVGRVDRSFADGDEQVAGDDAGPLGGAAGRHLARDDTFGRLRPEHAVLRLVPRRTRAQVGKRQRHQHDGDGDRQDATPNRCHQSRARVSGQPPFAGRIQAAM